MELYIYVDDIAQRVEMFQDEKVSVTSTIQNYSDIGKLFTDYSQSFTIPASPTNNAIFSHWYDNAVDNGYDARIRYNAYIEIETIPFKEGNVQLEKANRKNGYIESYTLTFYGNLTQLKDKFGDDKLNTLDYSSYNHELSIAQILDRVRNGTSFVRYPLIGNNRRFEYLTGNPTSDINLGSGEIKPFDLFPALSVEQIMLQIQQKYNISFQGNFLNYVQYKKLFLFLKNSTLPRGYNTGVEYLPLTFTNVAFPEYNSTTNRINSNWNGTLFPAGTGVKRLLIQFSIVSVSSSGVPYKVDLYQDGVIVQTFEGVGSSIALELYNKTQTEDSSNHSFYVKVSSQGNFRFFANLYYTRQRGTASAYTSTQNTNSTILYQEISSIQNIQSYVPDIKISDFFMGLVKMFNLIVTPLNGTTFLLQPLELYYQEGQIKDLTPFIYSDELDIEKPKLFKTIKFIYEKSENILNNAFSGLFNRQYGDLTFDSGSNSESGTYEIKLPFEDIMFERTSATNFITASTLNKDLQSYIPKPILLYDNGIALIDPAKPIRFPSNNVVQYNRFTNEFNSSASDLSYLLTLNWGNEVSPWYLVNSPRGLYERFYEQYIANLYNQKTRVLKAKAKLEPQNLTSLRLNDRIIIRDNRYIINSFTSDLTNGETSFELINDYRALGYNSIGYRFANIETLNLDKEEQEVQVDIYLGVFKQFTINSLTGFLSSPKTGVYYADESMVVTIAANTSGVDRTNNISIKFKDFDNVETIIEIPVIQYL